MSWSGKGPSYTAVEKMFRIACKKGRAETGRTKGNRKIEVAGEQRTWQTHYGDWTSLEGLVTCYYYNTPIFAIDFENKRITDFGMDGYSHSTGQQIQAWIRMFQRLNLQSLAAVPLWKASVWVPRARKMNHWKEKEPTWRDVLINRFRKEVPWCETDQYQRHWFRWDLYNHEVSDLLWDSIKVLEIDGRHRYFTYEWVLGKWLRRFIDADAVRRYNARQRRRGVKHVHVLGELPVAP